MESYWKHLQADAYLRVKEEIRAGLRIEALTNKGTTKAKEIAITVHEIIEKHAKSSIKTIPTILVLPWMGEGPY